MMRKYLKKLTTLVLASVVAAGTLGGIGTLEVQAAGIPAGAKSFAGHMYYVYKTDADITQGNAQTRCQAVGGHLVSITSAKEQAFVESLFQATTTTYSGQEAWIGLIYKNTSPVWVTGEKRSFTAANSDLPHSSYPCTSIIKNSGAWNDHSTTYELYYYICEWDTSTATVLPDQTTGIKVKKVDNQSLTVSWSKVTGAKGYHVYMKTGKNGTYKKVKEVKDPTVTSYYQAKLKKGTTYYFRVRAFKTIYGEKSFGELSDEKGITMK